MTPIPTYDDDGEPTWLFILFVMAVQALIWGAAGFLIARAIYHA